MIITPEHNIQIGTPMENIVALYKTIDKGYMEIYVSFDPRPKLYYKPYVDKINKMEEV